jgi:RecJ-like exonuclease
MLKAPITLNGLFSAQQKATVISTSVALALFYVSQWQLKTILHNEHIKEVAESETRHAHLLQRINDDAERRTARTMHAIHKGFEAQIVRERDALRSLGGALIGQERRRDRIFRRDGLPYNIED